jgi:queuine tRNA-ribosyltransferase
LHHLFNVKEMLGSRLNTIHNLWYFADLMRRLRVAIEQGTFGAFRAEFYRVRRQTETDQQLSSIEGADDGRETGQG